MNYIKNKEIYCEKIVNFLVIAAMSLVALFSVVGCEKENPDGDYAADYVEIEATEAAINPVLDEINNKLQSFNDFHSYYVIYNYNYTNDAGKTTKYKIDMKVDGDAAVNEVFAVLNMETFIESENIDHCYRICIYRVDDGQTFDDYGWNVLKASKDTGMYPDDPSDDTYHENGGNSLGGRGFRSVFEAVEDSSLQLTDSIFELINPVSGVNSYMKALMKYIVLEYRDTELFEENEIYIDDLTHPVTERLDHSTNAGAFIQELGHLRYVAQKSYKAYKSENGFYKLSWDSGATYYLKLNEDGTYQFKAVASHYTQELVPFSGKIPSPQYRDTYVGVEDPNKK